MEYILSKKLFDEIVEIIEWMTDCLSEYEYPISVKTVQTDLIALKSQHRAATEGVGNIKDMLADSINPLVVAVNNILKDGKVTLSDTPEGIKLFSALNDLSVSYPKILTEIMSINTLEVKIVALLLAKNIKNNILGDG